MAPIAGAGGGDELEGAEFDDEIYGFGGTDTIGAPGGDDHIDPGQGGREDREGERHFDTVDAGAGNDTMIVTWRLDSDPACHRRHGGAGADILIFDATAMDFVQFSETTVPVRRFVATAGRRQGKALRRPCKPALC